MIAAELKDGPWWLYDLVSSARAGETVVLECEGKPLVRLVPVGPGDFEQELRAYHADEWCGGATKADWDAMDREISRSFEDSANAPLWPEAETSGLSAADQSPDKTIDPNAPKNL